MEQLLKITTIPLEYQLKIQKARLEYSNSDASLEMHRTPGGFSMKSRPAKLNLDTFEARNSVVPTTRRSISQIAAKGLQTAQQTSAQYAQEGQQLLKPGDGGELLGQIFRQRAQMPTGEFQLGFIPSAPVSITYQEPDLTLNYEMDKLKFDLKVAQGNYQFVPGDIEMSITQHPDVQIEYIGEPMYVPPSASPNYEPLDVRA
ncbi:DUF6470 family protein [Mediterraneibacter agrestimuris]|uniref:DUF6470 family protein n=1 Tax=Mediterraneibacter agrestimuris TaxID=2941333 RepID=UPI00203D0525|nr:DUF6470 family protein [Mediterraneibacter agrestimuris]